MNYASVLQKKLTLGVTLIALVITVLSSLILAPLYTATVTNIVWAVTWIPALISLVLDLLEIATYVLCYPIIIYAFYRLPTKKATVPTLCFFGVMVLRYLINLIITWVQNKAVAGDDLTSILLYLIMEGIQLLLVVLLSTTAIRHFFRETAVADKAFLQLGQAAPSMHDRVFPFTKILNLQNPLQNAALRVGVLLSASKLLTRVLYDISMGVPMGMVDWAWAILYYLSDLLIAVIFYAVALLLLQKLDQKEQAISVQ